MSGVTDAAGPVAAGKGLELTLLSRSIRSDPTQASGERGGRGRVSLKASSPIALIPKGPATLARLSGTLAFAISRASFCRKCPKNYKKPRDCFGPRNNWSVWLSRKT